MSYPNQQNPSWQNQRQGQQASQQPNMQNQMQQNINRGVQNQFNQYQQQQQIQQQQQQQPSGSWQPIAAQSQSNVTPQQTAAQSNFPYQNSQSQAAQMNFKPPPPSSAGPQSSHQVGSFQPNLGASGQPAPPQPSWNKGQAQVAQPAPAASNFAQSNPQVQNPPKPQADAGFRQNQPSVGANMSYQQQQKSTSGTDQQWINQGLDSSAKVNTQWDSSSHNQSSSNYAALQTELQGKINQLLQKQLELEALQQQNSQNKQIHKTQIQGLSEQLNEAQAKNEKMETKIKNFDISKQEDLKNFEAKLAEKQAEINKLRDEIVGLKTQLTKLREETGDLGEIKQKAVLYDQKLAEEEQKNQVTKFFISFEGPAPRLIQAEEEQGLTKFVPRAWQELKGNKENQINIKQCWPIDCMAKTYASNFFQRFADQVREKGYTHHRAVRGDGNCFWRSVSYAYLEKLIFRYKIEEIRNLASNVYRKENPYYVMEDPVLLPGASDKIDGMDCNELVNVLCGGLLQLANSLVETSSIKTLSLLQKMYFQNPKFDKAMIFMLRKMTKNFILHNKEAQINGFDFTLLGIAEGLDLDAYIAEFVMKMGQDAIGSLLYLVPVVLRVNVQIVDLLKDRDGQPREVEVHEIHRHHSTVENLKFSCPNDKLDFHKEMTLYVLRKTGHYDVLYRGEEFYTGDPQNPCALDIEGVQDQLFSELQNYFQKRDGGQLQLAGVYRCPNCQSQTQSTDIKNRDNLPFEKILDPEDFPIPTCRNCSYELTEESLYGIFPDRFSSEISSYYQKRKQILQDREEQKKKANEEEQERLRIKEERERERRISVQLQKMENIWIGNERKLKSSLILQLSKYVEGNRKRELKEKHKLEKQKIIEESQNAIQRSEKEIEELKEKIEQLIKALAIQKQKTEEAEKRAGNWEVKDIETYKKWQASIQENKRLQKIIEDLKTKYATDINALNKKWSEKEEEYKSELRKKDFDKRALQSNINNLKKQLEAEKQLRITEGQGAEQNLTFQRQEYVKLRHQNGKLYALVQEYKRRDQTAQIQITQQIYDLERELQFSESTSASSHGQGYQEQQQIVQNIVPQVQRNNQVQQAEIEKEESNKREISELKKQLQEKDALIASLQTQSQAPELENFVTGVKQEAGRFLDKMNQIQQNLRTNPQSSFQQQQQQQAFDPLKAVFEQARTTQKITLLNNLKSNGFFQPLCEKLEQGKQRMQVQEQAVLPSGAQNELQEIVTRFYACLDKSVDNEKLLIQQNLLQQWKSSYEQQALQLEALKTELQECKEFAKNKEGQVKHYHGMHFEEQQKNQVLSQEIASLQEEKEQLIQKQTSIESESKENFNAQSQKIQNLQLNISELEQKIKELNSEYDDQKITIRTHVRAIKSLEEQIEQNKGTIQVLQTQVKEAQDEIQKKQSEIQQKEQEIIDALQAKEESQKSYEVEQQQSNQQESWKQKQQDHVPSDLELGNLEERAQQETQDYQRQESKESEDLNKAFNSEEGQTQIAEAQNSQNFEQRNFQEPKREEVEEESKREVEPMEEEKADSGEENVQEHMEIEKESLEPPQEQRSGIHSFEKIGENQDIEQVQPVIGTQETKKQTSAVSEPTSAKVDFNFTKKSKQEKEPSSGTGQFFAGNTSNRGYNATDTQRGRGRGGRGQTRGGNCR